LRVRGAPERLTAVIENVLDNALSFSPPEGTVRVELARRDRTALVTITDEGPGIPAGSEELVFARFYTYRPGHGKSEGHTGLGLALVKAIVEGYGGTVSAATRSAGGAILSIELPLA
jgi:two-component system sensor histidine kinase ChvG